MKMAMAMIAFVISSAIAKAGDFSCEIFQGPVRVSNVQVNDLRRGDVGRVYSAESLSVLIEGADGDQAIISAYETGNSTFGDARADSKAQSADLLGVASDGDFLTVNLQNGRTITARCRKMQF